MNSYLSLVNNQTFENLEKRILPRFPLSHLLFRLNETKQTFEVIDMSADGAQIELKNGNLSLKVSQNISGEVNWRGHKLDIRAQVKWVKDNRLGLEFTNKNMIESKIDDFMCVDHFIPHLKALHKEKYQFDIPHGLTTWLRAEGPLELFIWSFRSGEIAKFQVIIFRNFIEWQDGVGIKTGKTYTQRSLNEASLQSERTEWYFNVDKVKDYSKIASAKNFISKIQDSHLSTELKSFLLRKF